MAIYHLSVKNISRGKGQSSVASASYRSGEKLYDERLGQTFDYTRKERVEHTEVVTPDGVNEISRAELWNSVEASEKRHNSRVAREFEIAIPRELSADEQKALVLEFTKELVDKHRLSADVAIHTDKDNNNPHAHIMLSTRRIDNDGFGEKAREFDDKVEGPRTVEVWRERWASIANEHLKKTGLEARIDHRSYKEQGVDKEPTKHLGYVASEMEKNGVKTEVGEYNRRVNFINQLKEKVSKLSNSIKERASALLDAAKQTIGNTEYAKTRPVSSSKPPINNKWDTVEKALEYGSDPHKEPEANKISSGSKLGRSIQKSTNGKQATDSDRWVVAQSATAHLSNRQDVKNNTGAPIKYYE